MDEIALDLKTSFFCSPKVFNMQLKRKCCLRIKCSLYICQNIWLLGPWRNCRFLSKQCAVPILGVKFSGFVMAHFLMGSWCTSSRWTDYDVLLEKVMVAASILWALSDSLHMGSWCTSSRWADYDVLLEKIMVAASILWVLSDSCTSFECFKCISQLNHHRDPVGELLLL